MRNTTHDVDALRGIVRVADVLIDAGFAVRGKRIRCPIHDGDNQQAFLVERNHYHCFTCGAHGDVFALVMALHHCDFPSALVRVTSLAGLTTTPRLDSSTVLRRRQERDARDEAERTCNRRLLACADAYRELTRMADRAWMAPSCWDRMNECYTARDTVEAVEAALREEP